MISNTKRCSHDLFISIRRKKLIDVIDEASLADFTHTIELNQFDRASFEIPVDYKPNIIKEAQFFGFQSRDGAFCLFRISEKSYDIGLVYTRYRQSGK